MQNLTNFIATADPELLFFYTFWLVLFILCLPMAIKEYREWSKLEDEAARLLKRRK